MEQPHDPAARFEEFKELEDGSGFLLPSGAIFLLDKEGGWFDEKGNHFSPDGEPDEPSPAVLKGKKKLIKEQRLRNKVKAKGTQKMDAEEVAEVYDVVRIWILGFREGGDVDRRGYRGCMWVGLGKLSDFGRILKILEL